MLGRSDIDDRFVLCMAQLLRRENSPQEVRLNGKVRGIALTRVDRSVCQDDPFHGLEDLELD